MGGMNIIVLATRRKLRTIMIPTFLVQSTLMVVFYIDTGLYVYVYVG